MKKFIVFAGMLGLCFAPAAAMAQCGCDGLGTGGTSLVEAVTAHATFGSVSASSPVTITAGEHWVELNGVANTVYSVTYSGNFQVDGNIDASTSRASPYNSGLPYLIRTDSSGHWEVQFPKTSGAITVAPGSHTAKVWSDIFDPNNASIKDTKQASSDFTIS